MVSFVTTFVRLNKLFHNIGLEDVRIEALPAELGILKGSAFQPQTNDVVSFEISSNGVITISSYSLGITKEFRISYVDSKLTLLPYEKQTSKSPHWWLACKRIIARWLFA